MNQPPPKVTGGKAAGAAAIVLCAGLVAHFEGYSPTGYADPIAIPTACWGHTGDGVVVGRRYSTEQCEAWLNADLVHANLLVRRCITKRPMPLPFEAAMTSATFNAGAAIVCSSTLGKLANQGKWAQACAQLDRWVYARGIKFNGLVRRRAAERAMCEGRG